MSQPAASANAARSRAVLPPGLLAARRVFLAAFTLGAATVAGFAPLYLFPVPIVTLALLLWLWRHAERPMRAAALGWWFGFGFFLTGVSWVYVSLHTFGAMPAPLAAFFTLLFCAYLALFPAATGYVFSALRVPLWLKLTVVAPATWTLTEWIRGWLFTGFPWIAMGYSQVPMSPFAGYAPVLGIYGLTFMTLLSSALLVLLGEAMRRGAHRSVSTSARRTSRIAPAVVALVLIYTGGFGLKQIRWTTPIGEPITVALLQGNIPQDIKWTAEGLRTTLKRYRDLTLASDAKLIVLPETALPLFLRDVPAEYLADFAEHARRRGGDVLVGVPELLPSGDYYNSVISVGTSPPQAYRKWHLVPFGEYIPLRPVLGWLVDVLAIPLQDFSRGSLDAQPLAIAGQRVAMNVCYEDAFGEEIIRPLPQATLLVNVSNVAWFGHSIAPHQHLQISQARALETGRYMLRATNTGMTGVVDERGNIVEVAPQFTTASVRATAQGYTGATPYVRWGNSAIIASCIVMLLASALYARRHARTN
ncbi:MAG TPA: apolipoprotein N-acyltransferase [Burkholderiales bacterium]